MITQQQREARKQGIGGTDASAILGVNPYCNAHTVWLEKTGRKEPDDLSQKICVQVGIHLEGLVADIYSSKTGAKLRKVNATLYHKKYNFIFGHIDRRIIGKRKLLECKTARFFSAKSWGEQGTDQVPDHYFIQAQHYLAITEYDEIDLAALFTGSDCFKIYTIKRDDEIIEDMLIKLDNFWHHNVLADIPPQEIN